jgi:hypothetical protein
MMNAARLKPKLTMLPVLEPAMAKDASADYPQINTR